MKLMTDKIIVAKGRFTGKYFYFGYLEFYMIHFDNYIPVLYTESKEIAIETVRNLNNLRAWQKLFFWYNGYIKQRRNTYDTRRTYQTIRKQTSA